MSNHKFTTLEEIATLSISPRGEEKKLIKARWNSGAPKYEIRKFSVDGEKIQKRSFDEK